MTDQAQRALDKIMYLKEVGWRNGRHTTAEQTDVLFALPPEVGYEVMNALQPVVEIRAKELGISTDAFNYPKYRPVQVNTGYRGGGLPIRK